MIDPKQHLAAIDLGSNSFHMVVARVENNQIQVVDRLKEMVRLASGLNEKRVLSESKMQEAVECLSRFRQRINDLPLGNVAATGTMTLRRAKNSNIFMPLAEQALGFPINVVGGREEARLVYQGVAHSFSHAESNRLVIDIGGGSTEFIIGKGLKPKLMESLNMGCVNMTQKWFANGELKPEQFHAAIMWARQKLEWIADDYRETGWSEAIGSSGTAKAIGKILDSNFATNGVIRHAALLELKNLMQQQGKIRKLEIEGLSAKRAPVLAGGLSVMIAAFEQLRIEEMRYSEAALREGLLYDMLESASGHDIRQDAVATMCKRYGVDNAQSELVRQLALQFFDQILEPEAEKDERRLLLQWACDLHEMGLSISHSNYPEHSAYLVEQSDMAGFSREIQNTLGLMLRLQRGKFQQALIDAFPRILKGLRKLIVLFRLAILISRGRNPIQGIRLHYHAKHYHLTFPQGYLDTHPLSLAELKQEQIELAKAGLELSFD